MIALALLIIINILLVFYAIRSPGIALCYLFLFSSINNIILFDLGLIELRYGFVLIILFAFMYHLKPKETLNNFKFLLGSTIFWGVIFVIVGMIFSLTIVGGLSEAGYEKIYTFMGPVFFLFLAAAILIYSPWQLEEMSYGIIILGAVFFVVFYFLKDPSFIRNSIQSGYRSSINDPSINAITLARVCGLICIPSILYSIYSKFNYKRVLSIIMVILSSYWMIVSATRGVILSVVLVLCLYYLFNYRSKKNLPAYFVIGGILLLIIVGAIDITQLGVVDRFLEIAQYNSTTLTSTSVRFIGYLNAYDIFINNPVYGIGSSGFAEIYGRYPHSIFFELISEFGLSGLIAFILVVGSGVYYSIKILYNNIFDYKIDSLVLVWLYYLLAVQTSGNITINRDFWVMCGVLISIIHIAKMMKSDQKEVQNLQNKPISA